MVNLWCLTQVRPQQPKSSATHSHQCVQYCCVSKHVWLPVFGNVIMHLDVDACNFACGLYKHRKRVWEKNPLLHQGIEPASVLCLARWSYAQPNSYPIQTFLLVMSSSLRQTPGSAGPGFTCCKCLCLQFHVSVLTVL